MNEQVTTPETGSEPQDAQAVFETLLNAEESNDQPPVNETEVEETVDTIEDDQSDEVEEESDTDTPETTDYDEETEETDDEEPEAEKTYTIKAAGSEVEVTEADLIKSYQMEADYTKKSQRLSDDRKLVEANIAKIQESIAVRNEYAQKLEQVSQVLNEEFNSDEDLEQLRENDPVSFAVKIAERTENQKKLNVINQERQKVMQEQQTAQAQHMNSVVANEAKKLVDVIPEFSDKTKAENLKKEIRSYGLSSGFTDQEMGAVYDSRHVLMLNKAMKYDRLMKSKAGTAKKVSKAPKTITKGKKITNVDAYTKQQRRLQSSGSITDAAEVFKNFL